MTKRLHRHPHEPMPPKRDWLFRVGLGGVLLLFGGLAILLRGGEEEGIDPNFTPDISGAPALEVEQENLDFGDVRLGETVEAVFRIKNVGDQPLRIGESPQVEVLDGC